jgi:hypothetical protein
VLRLLPATASCTNLVQENQFPELNRHILTFFAINFTVWESHTDHRWRCSKEMMLIKKLSAFNFLGLSLSG